MKYKHYLWIIVGIMLLIAGCGREQQHEVKKNEQVRIQPGGQLNYGSLQEPDTLNPLLSEMLASAEVGRLVFSGLVITDNKGEWIADLAKEVPTAGNGGISADGLTVTYQLRSGITWHDGAPFTAEDVRFTWQAIMNPRNNIVLRDGYDKISSIELPDQYTVRVKFKEYYAPFLTLFSTILPKHLLQGADINKSPFNRSPVGTGPFKFADWRIADAIELTANPDYYKGKPKLDTVVYKFLPDANIMLTQVKNGGLDLAGNISWNQVDQVKAIAGFHTVISPNMIWEHLDFNLDNSLFQDVRIRQAIALGIDRQALVANVLNHVASPAVGDQSPLSWAYNPSLTAAGRNVDEARSLLVQAGWRQGADGVFIKEGRRLTFSLATTGGNKIREGVAQAIAGQLREVGIEVAVQLVDPALFFSETLPRRRFETALYAWVSGVDPDNKSLWNSQQIPSQYNGYKGKNYPGWRNAEVDQLTEQGLRTVDLRARKMVYFRLQEILLQEYPVVPLYFRANIDVVKNKVVNYKPNPTPAGNFWNAWEIGFSAN